MSLNSYRVWDIFQDNFRDTFRDCIELHPRNLNGPAVFVPIARAMCLMASLSLTALAFTPASPAVLVSVGRWVRALRGVEWKSLYPSYPRDGRGMSTKSVLYCPISKVWLIQGSRKRYAKHS